MILFVNGVRIVSSISFSIAEATLVTLWKQELTALSPASAYVIDLFSCSSLSLLGTTWAVVMVSQTSVSSIVMNSYGRDLGDVVYPRLGFW